MRPSDIKMELRIYQNDGVICHEPDPNDIVAIMEKIVHFDKLLEDLEYSEG